jgi:hypothetical protein
MKIIIRNGNELVDKLEVDRIISNKSNYSVVKDDKLIAYIPKKYYIKFGE